MWSIFICFCFFKLNSFFFYFSNFSSAFTIERINGRSATLTHNATLFRFEWSRLTWSKQFVTSSVNVKKCSNARLANGSLTQSLQPMKTTCSSYSAMEITQNRRDILFAIQEVGEPKNKRCNVRWLVYIINLYVKMCTLYQTIATQQAAWHAETMKFNEIKWIARAIVFYIYATRI